MCIFDMTMSMPTKPNPVLSPEEIAFLHPRLFHITRPQALPSICKHGLLSTHQLLALFDVPSEDRRALETMRRPTSIEIAHPEHGKATLTDNAPLSETALSQCLDDGLRPSDWMQMLNQRVFFWVDEKNMTNHLRASTHRGEKRIVMVFDTLSVVQAYYKQIELAPINTGSTIRKPARRGLSTFAAAHQHSYRDWQKLRGGRDRIKELTVVGGIQDIGSHLIACSYHPLNIDL
ncbi:hypothetical protein [Pseudomonas sp. URIL14HWK12:I6]|uniref:DUF7002 family protein n=1 Tax=Pseudomonas sp. URIL14HWK12:I6 TaxID=1283293 RepID=UPI0012DF19E8|nr:hypothetical protein [Pseudomonas sp. URIL14HWK12:I6]